MLLSLVTYLIDQEEDCYPWLLGLFSLLICISLVLYYPGLSYFSLNVLLFLYGVFSATEIIVFIMAKECSGAELSGTVFAATNMIVTLGGVHFPTVSW